MKRLMSLALLSVFAMPAYSGLDDAQLDLSLTPFSFEVFENDTKTYDGLQLDIEISPRFFKANGALKYSVNDDGFPVMGTCALTQDAKVFCTIDASFATLYVELDGELNGVYILNDAAGTFLSEGTVGFVSLN